MVGGKEPKTSIPDEVIPDEVIPDEVAVGCLVEEGAGGKEVKPPPFPLVGGDIILKALNGSNDELFCPPPLVLVEELKLPPVTKWRC